MPKAQFQNVPKAQYQNVYNIKEINNNNKKEIDKGNLATPVRKCEPELKSSQMRNEEEVRKNELGSPQKR